MRFNVAIIGQFVRRRYQICRRSQRLCFLESTQKMQPNDTLFDSFRPIGYDVWQF